jgi:signal transduction histidine kinase
VRRPRPKGEARPRGRPPERGHPPYRQLFDIVPCYITVQDRDYRILEANEIFRRDFGGAVGTFCYQSYKGRDHVCPDCPVARTFGDGEVHSSEETVVTRDGRQASVIVQSMPVVEGQTTAVMEVSTNITAVKRLQHQLALMGTAVQGMAHRIKNILMGLEGGIFVVNTGFETDERQTVADGWQMVQRNVERVSRLVKDLLYCSKQQAPELQAGVRPVEVAREVYELFRARTASDGITLELEVDPAVGAGSFDREGLVNLLENLISNAVDACRFDLAEGKPGHRIVLRCRPGDGGGVLFEVADNGMGIPDDAQHRVFENFFSTKGTEGTGLGLLVVQKVAAEHGGSVTFSSRTGEGTTFRVTLPYGPEG